MPLQDIRYVMSVDDKQAQSAIQKTVGNLKSLDNARYGENSAQGIVSAIESAGDAAGSTFAELGNSLGAIFGGTALGNAAANAISKSMAAVSGAATAALAGVGAGAGIELGKRLFGGVSAEMIKLPSLSARVAAAFSLMLKPLREGLALMRWQSGLLARLQKQGYAMHLQKLNMRDMFLGWDDIKASLSNVQRDFGLLFQSIRAGAANGIRNAFLRSGRVLKDVGRNVVDIGKRITNTFRNLPNKTKGGLDGLLKSARQTAGGIALAFDMGLSGVATLINKVSDRAFTALSNPGQTLKGMATGVSNAFSGAWTGITAGAAGAWAAAKGISLKAVAGMTAGVLLGVGAIGTAFGGVAAHANTAWSEVEDGIMVVQASLVGMGESVEEAFSDKVTDAILKTGETMAYAFGTMPREVAAATSVLMKNLNVDTDTALSQMGLLNAIVAANPTLTLADAAQKLVAARNGEVRQLKDIGIWLKSTGDLTQDAARATDELIRMYGNPALAKPFIDDNPLRAAAAAINLLWVNLGKGLDPSMTAMAQALADVILGIAVSLKDTSNSDFIPNIEGVIAAIGAVTDVVVRGAIIVGNIFQMLWTGVISLGESIWHGVQWGWAWISEKLAKLTELIGEAISLIPGTGDAGQQMQDRAKAIQAESKKAMESSGAAFADAAKRNGEALSKDMKDIAAAVAPGGGPVGSLAEKGRAAREKAQKEAMEKAKPLPEGEKAQDEKEQKAKEEAEKRAKKEREAKEQEERINRERSRMNGQRINVVLNTPQRSVAAIRHGRRRA